MTEPSSDNYSASGKGKEPEIEAAPSTSGLERSESHPVSLASRLQASATALSRAVINGQPENATLETASTDKQQQFSSRGSASSVAGELSQSRPSHGNIGSRFAGAASDSASEDRYNNFIGPHRTTIATPFDQSALIHDHRNGTSTFPSQHTPGPSAVELQEGRDGIEAVQLLSNLAASDAIASDDFDSVTAPVLSLDEATALKASLFGDKQPKGFTRIGQNWNDLLNFQPDFIVAGDINGTYQHLGVRDPVQAEQMWLDDWKSVLNSYTDEVWGDLGPLADAARNELEDARDPSRDSRPADMKALGRLRQVLAHIRDSH